MTDATSRITLLLGGRYRLQRELARGGMATVFHARDEVLERDVAVKVLHRHLAGDETFLDRFLREARAAAGLSHPNVTSVYDWGQEVDGYGGVSAYLVMEFVDGPSLRDLLAERGRLSPAEAAAVLMPAAAGIAAAHVKGLVHRDVKPENVLITSNGMVKVTDFGLARAVAASRQTFGPGTVAGSPHYLAPEALKGGPIDTRADVYALGVLLYECLVGQPPFESDTVVGSALRRAWETVPPPSQTVPVPEELDEVVARATDLEPDARYDDARAFQEALGAVVKPGEVPVSRRDTSRDTRVLPPDTLDTRVVGPPVAAPRRRGAASPPAAGPTVALQPTRQRRQPAPPPPARSSPPDY